MLSWAQGLALGLENDLQKAIQVCQHSYKRETTTRCNNSKLFCLEQMRHRAALRNAIHKKSTYSRLTPMLTCTDTGERGQLHNKNEERVWRLPHTNRGKRGGRAWGWNDSCHKGGGSRDKTIPRGKSRDRTFPRSRGGLLSVGAGAGTVLSPGAGVGTTLPPGAGAGMLLL